MTHACVTHQLHRRSQICSFHKYHFTTESNPRQVTSGAVPTLSLNATAVVQRNKMFVLGGRDRNASADRDVDNHMEKGPSTYDFCNV